MSKMNQIICVLSDTHNNREAASKAVSRITELAPGLVIHCGDIQSPDMLDFFAELPVRFVFGNCDYEQDALISRAHDLGLHPPELSLELELHGKEIYVQHGHHDTALGLALQSQTFDYIFHGHSHQKCDEQDRRTRIINPGALYRAAEYTFASLNLATDELQFHSIDKR